MESNEDEHMQVKFKRPNLKSISRSNNPTPPKKHHKKDQCYLSKPYHSSKHSKVEEIHLFSPEKVLQCLIFPTTNSLSKSPLETSSSLVLPSQTTRKDSSVLLTELAEVPKSSMRSLNVSWADFSQISPSTDPRPCNIRPNSLNVSILDTSKPHRFPAEKTNNLKLTIEIENRIIQEQNESQPSSPMRGQSTIRENLGFSMLQECKCEVISFYEAFNHFNLLELSSLGSKSLWKTGFFMKLCRCIKRSEELDEQSEELCEKIVRFAYSRFDLTNTFHKNLLISACVRIFRVTEIPEDPEVILNDLMKRILWDSDILLLGFFNVLFLDAYFSNVLENIDRVTREQGIDPLKVILKITKVNLQFLRMKKMNFLIERSQKCFELIFFVFAGLCLYFVELFQRMNWKNAFKVLVENSRENLQDILGIARKEYLNQVTQI